MITDGNRGYIVHEYVGVGQIKPLVPYMRLATEPNIILSETHFMLTKTSLQSIFLSDNQSKI